MRNSLSLRVLGASSFDVLLIADDRSSGGRHYIGEWPVNGHAEYADRMSVIVGGWH